MLPGVADGLKILVIGVRDQWWHHYKVSRLHDRVWLTCLVWPAALAVLVSAGLSLTGRYGVRRAFVHALVLCLICYAALWAIHLPLALLPRWYRY